jgi:hypothetical protein
LKHLPEFCPKTKRMTKRLLGLAEFNELLESQQFDLLHRDGVYVGKRKEGKQTIVLFQLYSFYIEVYYKQYRKQIDHIVTTDDANILHFYIDQVNVRGLNRNSQEDGPKN